MEHWKELNLKKSHTVFISFNISFLLLFSYPTSDRYEHGDWFWDKDNKEMTFLIEGSGTPEQPHTLPIQYNVYRCFFLRCSIPVPPKIPDGRPSPDQLLYWSKKDDWKGTEAGYGGSDGNIPSPGNSFRFYFMTNGITISWSVFGSRLRPSGRIIFVARLQEIITRRGKSFFLIPSQLHQAASHIVPYDYF